MAGKHTIHTGVENLSGLFNLAELSMAISGMSRVETESRSGLPGPYTTRGALMATVESTWVARYRYARVLLDQRMLVERGVRVDDVEFGQMVADCMEPKRAGAFSKASVSQWGSAKQAPPTVVRRAIALVCGVDPGWLDHGPQSAAPAPAGWREPTPPAKKKR